MDIRHLMERNVKEGIMTRELMENILRRAELDYPEGSLDDYVDGATYVSLSDSMKLQKNISESSVIDIIVERKQNNRMEEVEAACERSWSPAINFIQMEDATGFGYPLKAIKRCTSYDVDSPVMMMWMVASALVGSKDIWEAVDQKRGFFRYDGWDGYLLTHLYGVCMKHDEITSPRGSPFKPSKCRSAESVLGHLKRFMPEDMRRDSSRRRGLNDRNLFFKFSLDYVKKLLPRNVYPNILVCDPVELRNITNDLDLTDTNVIIVVDSKKSNGEDYQHPANTEDTIQVNGIQYEARVINHTATRMNAEIPDHFCGRRLCRHGGPGFPSWWEQRRYVESPVLMTHSQTNSVFEERYWDESRYRAFASTIVYVRTKMPTVEELRDDFHQMLGGQTRARCQCNDFPLIVSSRGKEKGRKCMNENCSRKERYVCINTSCATRLCDHCLEELPRSPTTVLAPPTADDIVEEGNVKDGMNDNNDGSANEHPSFRSCVLENRGHVENDYVDRVGADDEAVDEFFLGEYLTRSNFNPMDPQCETEDSSADVIPTTNAGDFAYTVLDKNEKKRKFPCHILLNQVGVLLTRYNNRIEGTYAQKNFIQRIVSTICGLSFPLVYLMGTLFPRHFYAQAKHDPHAILGVPPLCCYNHKNHPFGMASTLDFSRTLLTHSSSSASNCHTTAAFLYDVQANKAMSNMDSRVIGRSGYMVDVMSAHGISARGKGETDLTESVDSHEAARDLAGAQPWSPSEQFLTFTCNQKKHPGISHLHAYKEGMAWMKFIPRYNSMSDLQKWEVKRAFEQAYGSILGRCWCEARKFWLEYLTYSVNCIIGEAEHTFWRYELQEDDGGLAHIHGLRSLRKEHMSNKEVRDFVYSLQKCCVAELFPTNKIQEYIDEGLFENEGSWYKLTDLGKEILRHKHSERCKIRISDAEGEDSFKCKKPDPVRGRERPWEHELRPLPYTFSEECCAILEKCGLYEPPRPGQPQGTFKNQMFQPSRHFGPCDPKDTLNISPVNPKCFAATQSMQNYQVLIGTNGATRYVVKYVTSLDAGNKATVWSAAHTGGGMRVENKFLHNTKIGRSKANEESASKMSRSNTHESGRKTSFFEMQQQMLGYSEVMTTFNFCRICTKPLEHRSTTQISLDDIGKLRRPDLPDDEQDDAYSTVSVAQSARLRMNLPGERCLRPNQELLYRHSGIKASSYDEVTQYGLRPVELLIAIQTLAGYYRWFHIDPKTLSSGKIKDKKLSDEVWTTFWIDGLGRQVKLRVQAFEEVKDYLNGRNDTDWDTVDRNAKELILALIDKGPSHPDWDGVATGRGDEGDDGNAGRDAYYQWVIEDGKRDLPIPVFSGVTPHNPVMFLLHLMLVCGEYETELDFRSQPTMRKSLLTAKLIGYKTDDESLEQYSIDLVNTVIEEVLPRQPIVLRLLDDFVVASKRLFDGVLKDDEIPITDLPPCILTELLDKKDKELQSFWEKKKGDQLNSIYKTLSGVANLPSKDEVMKCNRRKHALWPTPPLTGGFERSEHQSAESYEEQQLVVKLGIKGTIDKYRIEIGPEATTFTKGLLIRGVPGSGKSHLAQYLALYAFSRGLRVMTTALMALRAVVLGGIHYHILAAVPTKNNSNVYHLAELAIESLRRKSQFLHLHVLLTMDVLVIDEIGQLSAQQMSILDIILRKLRDTDIPFGGVLVSTPIIHLCCFSYEDSSIASSLLCKIIATCDHAQFQAIRGLPFFLSTHLLTDFNVVELRKSVRAHGDPVLQRIQDITRMSPTKLLENPELEVEFKSKAKACFRSARDWQDPIITPNVQRMYSLRKPTQEAQDEYVSSSICQFDANNVHYALSRSTDIQRAVGSRAEFVPMTSRKLLNRINKEIKEPPRLLFWEGAMFEATRNGDGYNNAQLLLMIEVPSEATVRAKAPIKVIAAPAGVSYLDVSNGVPTREELEANGWKQVSIRPAKELAVTVMGIVGYRKQYAMTHLGASTINKQTGNTISGLCAIEMSSSCVPWEKPQIVVMLSRTTKGPDIIIVAENFNDAIDEMWNVITKGNQWTAYVENLLERLSIHPSKLTNMEEILSPEARVIDLSRTYPMRMCDFDLPTDSSGYVYYIFSVREPERGYIGETKNLSHRLYTHNRGRGAKDTADVFYRPYSIAAYIFGLSHMDTQQRRRLEAKWKHYNVMSMNAGNKDVFDRIENGKKVVREHNTWADESEKISFAITVKRGAISGNN
jgi:predicted GIY-YIG superfamily endonuclease